MELTGIPAAPGYAIGKAVVLHRSGAVTLPERISPDRVEIEQERFRTASRHSAEQLAALRERCQQDGRSQEALILDAHIELLLDEDLEKDVTRLITTGLQPAERAVESVLNQIVAEMGELEAEYARQRAEDFEQLKDTILRALRGEGLRGPAPSEPVIVVGRELAPSDTAAIETSMLLGLVSETGGLTSHIGIIARSLRVPAVLGIPHATGLIRDGDAVLVDGFDGRVFINPPGSLISEYEARRERLVEDARLLDSQRDLPAISLDGAPIRLAANIAGDAEADLAIRFGADGVGLLRTEFLFLDRGSMPSEEEQFRAYRDVAARFVGSSTIIRTLDAGGDKPLPYLPQTHEANPFLGRRAIRLYGLHPDLIRTQLRAILRASHYGSICLMFPMITSLDEILQLREILDHTKDELQQAGIAFDATIPVGIMIETPAAAMIAERLIEHVDFFSVGANDLTQYTLAADRGNEHLAELYDPLHPAVLRLIKLAVDASHAAGKWTGLCGEVAGYELATILWLGLSIDELSMSPNRIPRVKDILRRLTKTEATSVASESLRAGSAREVRSLLAGRGPAARSDRPR